MRVRIYTETPFLSPDPDAVTDEEWDYINNISYEITRKFENTTITFPAKPEVGWKIELMSFASEVGLTNTEKEFIEDGYLQEIKYIVVYNGYLELNCEIDN